MHFRVRGNNVQIVKTEVDKKTLKSKSVPVGSANIKKGVLSDELLGQLNPDEVKEARLWIHERQRISNLQSEVDAHLLAGRIYETATWLKETKPSAGAGVVAEVQRAMAALRRTATKIGMAKAKSMPKR